MNRYFKTFLASILSSAVCCGTPQSALAQDVAGMDQAGPLRSVFSVSNIVVDISAASAAAARSQAIAQAHRIAFSNVFVKMVAREDWGLEPALTNAELAALVSAVDVRGEKSSQTRYVAELSVAFDKEALLGVFKSAGVTYTDSETPPIIMLPIASYGGATLLWSADNVWRNAWLASATRAQSLVSYTLLSDAPEVSSQISALGAADAAPQQLIKLIRGQQASDIVIAYGDVRFDLAAARYEGVFDVRRGPQQAPFMAFDISQNAGETPPDMLERAIALIDGELSALWKRQLLVEYAQARDVRIAATFDTPAQWQRMLAAFGRAKRLRNVSLERLQLDSAALRARFVGDFAPLEEAMSSAGIMLTQAEETSWRARAMTAQERASLQIDSLEGDVSDFVDPLEEQAMQRAKELEAPRAADGPQPVLDIDTVPWETEPPEKQQDARGSLGGAGESVQP